MTGQEYQACAGECHTNDPISQTTHNSQSSRAVVEPVNNAASHFVLFLAQINEEDWK